MSNPPTSHMNEATPEKEAFQAACRQVGEFLYYFSLLEREIDNGIGKLLRIEVGALDIVTANIDFVRKVNVLRSAEGFKATVPDENRKKMLKKTFTAILALNDKRKIVAHCPFVPGNQSGVVFRRAVASSELKVENLEWSDKDFKAGFAESDRLTKALHQITEEMVPYTPSLDFSDPRNSMYFALFT